MKIQQECFSPSDEQLMKDIEELRVRRKVVSKSKMIDILLHLAVKEANRKKKASLSES